MCFVKNIVTFQQGRRMEIPCLRYRQKSSLGCLGLTLEQSDGERVSSPAGTRKDDRVFPKPSTTKDSRAAEATDGFPMAESKSSNRVIVQWIMDIIDDNRL